jgi:hypothetical protein
MLFEIFLPLCAGSETGGGVHRTAQLANEGNCTGVVSSRGVEHESRELHVTLLCHFSIVIVFLRFTFVAKRFDSSRRCNTFPCLGFRVNKCYVPEQSDIRQIDLNVRPPITSLSEVSWLSVHGQSSDARKMSETRHDCVVPAIDFRGRAGEAVESMPSIKSCCLMCAAMAVSVGLVGRNGHSKA